MDNGFKTFRKNIKYLDGKHLNIKPLIYKLLFIKNKNTWGHVLRYGFLEIDRTAFEIIARGMLGFIPKNKSIDIL